MDTASPAPSDLVEGYVDSVADGAVFGWAWSPTRPQAPLVIEAVRGGVVLSSTEARLFRADLRDAGKRGGWCAFRLPLAEHLKAGEDLHVQVRAQGGAELANSPVVVHAPAPAKPAPASPSQTSGPFFTPTPLTLRTEAGEIGVLEGFGPGGVHGWVHPGPTSAPAPTLTLHENGEEIARILADDWRYDLAEVRQGDGRGAYSGRLPARLFDDREHALEVRIDGAAGAALRMRAPPNLAPPAPAPWPQRLARRPKEAPAETVFSFIVVFYNMKREAARTLTSLSRAYQHDIGDLGYEVICIDNGSKEPLSEEWIRSFGPEFRVYTPNRIDPSPCRAINEAAATAKGRYVAVMIDGAHVLTPGVLREAWDALDEDPQAVVALRHWFIGGDQRWFSETGYSRAQEDLLFARIKWPQNGYDLFRISVPIQESPRHWFDGLAESNCLFMPAELYRRIGGLDEAFSTPGGGFCNLDLFTRAAEASGEHVVQLIGEASFHQYHQGTTTNVSDADKDRQVRGYEAAYRALRGRDFQAISPEKIRLRGGIRSPFAVIARQTPLFAAAVGVTEKVRPGALNQHYETGSQHYLQSVYAECGLHTTTRWLGSQVSLAPTDLVSIQEIIVKVRPERIITNAREDGLLRFLDSMLTLAGLDHARILNVLGADGAPAPFARLDPILSDLTAPETEAALRRAIGAEESVLAIFEPGEDDFLPLDKLRALSRFVSHRSYLIYLRTALGQPWLGYSKYWHQKTIQLFVDESEFAIDRSIDRHIVTSNPWGYLQRVKGRHKVEAYDASLDSFDTL